MLQPTGLQRVGHGDQTELGPPAHSLQPPALGLHCGLLNSHLFCPNLLHVCFAFFVVVVLPLNPNFLRPRTDLRVPFSAFVKWALSYSPRGTV